MVHDRASCCVLQHMGSKEEAAMLSPACGEGAQSRFLPGAMLGDGRAEELLMGPYDATFAVGALSVLPRGEDARLPLEKGQL